MAELLPLTVSGYGLRFDQPAQGRRIAQQPALVRKDDARVKAELVDEVGYVGRGRQLELVDAGVAQGSPIWRQVQVLLQRGREIVRPKVARARLMLARFAR